VTPPELIGPFSRVGVRRGVGRGRLDDLIDAIRKVHDDELEQGGQRGLRRRAPHQDLSRFTMRTKNVVIVAAVGEARRQ
jgi:hypothetical protein